MIRNNPANTDIWPQPPPWGRHIRLDDVMDMEMSLTLHCLGLHLHTCAVFMVIFVVMVNIIVSDNTLALHLPRMDDLGSPPEIF